MGYGLVLRGLHLHYMMMNMYVFHHPLFLKDNDEYRVLKWEEQFKGDTCILFKDYPTAIVNMNRYKDYASLLAIVVHELFHCYQYLNKESRFQMNL